MRKCKLASIALAAYCMSPLPGNSTNYFTEGFDDITQLTANGWSQQNLSGQPGSTNWFRPADDNPFYAYDGAPDAYLAANYNNAVGSSGISNWLMTPVLDFGSGATLTFYTRTTTPGPLIFPDRLEVRLSTNGASTNAGQTQVSVGDFTTLKLSINPDLTKNVYPTIWTQYPITDLPHHGQGRIAFRYFIDGNTLGYNADYIGIDRVVYSSGFPEYQVGGNVYGLGAATGLTLLLNGANYLSVAADGTFQFPAYLSSGTSYSVTVSTQPGDTPGPCGVTNGKGVMAAADVASIVVSCDGIFINDFEIQSLVQDGGFETGPLSRYWAQTSTNFGVVIYGSNFARTGSFFAYFGGTPAAEVSSIQQAGVIAAGSTTLEFHVWWDSSVDPPPDPDAYFKAKIDGNTVFSLTPATASAYTGGYTPVSVDISAYADGKNHLLRFESNNAAASESTNVLLDDVSIAGP